MRPIHEFTTVEEVDEELRRASAQQAEATGWRCRAMRRELQARIDDLWTRRFALPRGQDEQ